MANREQFLVDTQWLQDNLADPSLRVFDCTVYLRPRPEGGVTVESGREHYDQGHIPGAGFADLKTDLSDTSQSLRFMLPSAEQLAEVMGRYGVSNDSNVVLYDANNSMWAARVWWNLRTFGFENARLLDGGWKKWKAEGRPVSTEPATYPPTTFAAQPNLDRIASKDDVLAATGDGAICIINALAEDQHEGKTNAYGRPGHIPGSVNVPAMRVIDPETGAYLPLEELRAKFEGVGATSAGRVITYCGGGIAASSDAFVLTMLGQDNVAVYDASLSEWAADPALPLET